MHLFSHGHLHVRQRHMARGRVRTNDGVAEKWPLMAAIWCPAFSPPAGQLMHAAGLQSASKQFDIGDPFYDQLTAAKLGYPLTSIT